MLRRPAVLLTFPRDSSSSSLFLALLALSLEEFVLDHENQAHPLPFQSSTHSFAKAPGWHQERSFHSSTLNPSSCSPATPLSATLTDDLRVLPCFVRNRPLASPLDATLAETSPVTSLSATLTKNWGGSSARPIDSTSRNMERRTQSRDLLSRHARPTIRIAATPPLPKYLREVSHA